MRFAKSQNPLDHLPALRRFARALCRDEAAADDLVQDALVRAYEGFSTFRKGASLKNWLFTIQRNVFFSDRRRDKAEILRLEGLQRITTDQIEPVQEHQAYLRQILNRFLDLPVAQREILHLISVEGLDYQEAALVLDIPIGTVMSRLSRARAALRTIETEAEAKAIRNLRIVGGGKDNG